MLLLFFDFTLNTRISTISIIPVTVVGGENKAFQADRTTQKCISWLFNTLSMIPNALKINSICSVLSTNTPKPNIFTVRVESNCNPEHRASLRHISIENGVSAVYAVLHGSLWETASLMVFVYCVSMRGKLWFNTSSRKSYFLLLFLSTWQLNAFSRTVFSIFGTLIFSFRIPLIRY